MKGITQALSSYPTSLFCCDSACYAQYSSCRDLLASHSLASSPHSQQESLSQGLAWPSSR